MMFRAVFFAELIKLRRSRVLPALSLAYLMAPVIVALMMAALYYPELGDTLGILTVKAELTIGEVNWAVYVEFVSYVFIGGIIIMGIAVSYLFGREYSDSTAKIMLSLPVNRLFFVLSKLTVVSIWFLLEVVLLIIIAVILGFAVGLSGFDTSLLTGFFGRVMLLYVELVCIAVIPAWITVRTESVIAPIGTSVAFLLAGELFSQTSLAAFIPWSVIFQTAGLSSAAHVHPASSAVIMAVTIVAGIVFTTLSLDTADNSQ